MEELVIWVVKSPVGSAPGASPATIKRRRRKALQSCSENPMVSRCDALRFMVNGFLRPVMVTIGLKLAAFRRSISREAFPMISRPIGLRINGHALGVRNL